MVLASGGGSGGSAGGVGYSGPDVGGGGGGGTGLPSEQDRKTRDTFAETANRNANRGGSSGAMGAGGLGGGYEYGGRATTPTSAAASHGTAKNPTVYLGPDSRIAFTSATEAQSMYYKFDAKTKSKYLSQLSLAGYDTGSMKDDQLASLWASYVTGAANYSLAGKWISPWEIIGKDIAQREVAAAKPKTVTQTSTQYNLSTAGDAQALFQGAAQTLLGRDPTKAEIARFKSTLNKYEQANPTTTTTTSNYIGSDLQSQSSTTKGGVSAASQQLMAQEEAKRNPEYGAYQAATNGMNWLMEMIGGS